MNYQQSALVGCVGVRDMNISMSNGVVCPKPRRTGLFNFILTEGNYDVESSNFDMASSPPFCFGSPPSRVSNPLIQDSQFCNDNFVPIIAIPEKEEAAASLPQSFTSASARKNGGGCAPMKFGSKPAVRIEGFNCRGSVSAVA